MAWDGLVEAEREAFAALRAHIAAVETAAKPPPVVNKVESPRIVPVVLVEPVRRRSRSRSRSAMQLDAAAGPSSDSLARQLEAVELVDLMDVDLSSIEIGEQDELLKGFCLEQAKRKVCQEASKKSPSKQRARKESTRHRRRGESPSSSSDTSDSNGDSD